MRVGSKIIEKDKLLACEIRQGRDYLINGKLYTILRIIPMEDVDTGIIKDIEFLLNKKENIYFSYNMYRNGKSWVETVEEV